MAVPRAEHYVSGAGTSDRGCKCGRNKTVLVSTCCTLLTATSCQFCLELAAHRIHLSSYFLPLFLFSLSSHSQELQAEVNAHKQQVQRVLDKGKTMIVGQHPSAQKISEKCQELVTAWQGLEKSCDERMKQLQHSVGFQEVQIKAKSLRSSFFSKQEDKSVKVNKKPALLGLVFSSVACVQTHGNEGLDCIVECSPHSRSAALQASLGLHARPWWLCMEHAFLLVVAPFSVPLYSLRLWLN